MHPAPPKEDHRGALFVLVLVALVLLSLPLARRGADIQGTSEAPSPAAR
ncbi:MAG: hypothetical protein K1X74_12835 [Pirellulales bacterium]|nr:hypothetical protein [Pirellulales bacterium]